jgi:hypothetical protein
MVAIFFSSQLETSRDQPVPISKKAHELRHPFTSHCQRLAAGNAHT